MKQNNENNYVRVSYNNFMTTRNRQFGNELTNFQRIPTRSASQFICSKPILKMEEEIIPPEFVNPYVVDIFEYLCVNQHKFMCQTPFYMNLQLDITNQMRSILIDWLVDVHLKFKLQPETLYLTINLIDRYLSKNTIMRNKLQLVGIASLFIASKFEEIYAPELKDFVHVCDNAYTKEEILEMESKILLTVQFSLTYTSPLKFLERQIQGANLCDKINYASRMILELSLLDIKCLKFSSSLLATTSILLAINMLRSPQVLPSSLHYIEDQEELRQCLSEFLPVISLLKSFNMTAIRRKYQLEKFNKIADVILTILPNQQ
ncbi:unnamed protein product (macronuclear) [Paramecium tetraurelia]|uniref:Uncharacterized protein n=1 Tax=Paramecium tetraurelia TaxID=5888 RepID=A0CCD8_PARTE|nr:uncharacterized protein GSPATT00037240001 [Paramecium tetraurelia]CAK68455.1 unnamed protein product [Paramecium tetraurelia]|eukprot:XP_001435852.1 hypothetical protein (macronuclear) [Paramecium tetraurelia strain d4-2]